jgi:type III pantothenate kinase
MILEIDAGNTRIKWRLRKREGNEWVTQSEGFVFAEEKTPVAFLEFGRQLEKMPVSDVERMLVASVRGDDFRTAFTTLMTEKWRITPEFAESSSRCAGVVNGYTFPEKLGVDRWLAMVAAYDDAGRACCILNCGTTITFDLMANDGRHLGGYIVPGLRLMRNALAARSPALMLSTEQWGETGLGDSTEKAIHHGLLKMAAGFAADLHKQYEKMESPIWYISGGDGELLQRHLPWSTKLVPTLVLDGLALAMLA